jgi:hypothetical protein
MIFVPRGTQVAALLSGDGTEVECFVQVYACNTLAYNLYVCIFSLRLRHYRLLFVVWKASGEVGPLKMVRILLCALIGVSQPPSRQRFRALGVAGAN